MKGGKKEKKKGKKKNGLLKNSVLPPFYSHCPDLVKFRKKVAEKN